MIVTTRDFGNIEITKDDIFTVLSPILGFEEYSRFTLIKDEEIGEGICWLQSVEEPGICFILIAATGLDDYSFEITQQMHEQLEIEAEGALSLCYCIAVIGAEPSQCTVNKKAPIIFNPEKKSFGQYVLDENFPIRAPLSAAQQEEV